MDWKALISKAYNNSSDRDLELKPVFYHPASEDDIYQVEQALGRQIHPMLRDLLLEINGFGEEMFFEDGQKRVDLGSFLLTTTEIVEYTLYYRSSGLDTNVDFNEMVFFGDTHVDGVYFALRAGEDGIYEWDPYEAEFRLLSGNLKDFMADWLSGKLSI